MYEDSCRVYLINSSQAWVDALTLTLPSDKLFADLISQPLTPPPKRVLKIVWESKGYSSARNVSQLENVVSIIPVGAHRNHRNVTSLTSAREEQPPYIKSPIKQSTRSYTLQGRQYTM